MWHAFDEQETYLAELTDHITARLRHTVQDQGYAGFAVSGGKSPIPLFQRLSQADIPWEKIHITLVDERFVSPADPDSNEYLVRQHLLANRASKAQFTGLVSHPANIAKCVQQANSQNHDIAIVLLGMGDDGHTASLFPGAPQLAQALDTSRPERYVQINPPAAPYERISMTLAAILKAQHLVLAIAGQHKHDIYQQASRQATPTLPVSYLIAQTGAPLDVYWHA